MIFSRRTYTAVQTESNMSRTKRKSVMERLGLTKGPEKSNESYYGDVVIFGAPKVGKTSIAERFVYNYFTDRYNPTFSEARYHVDALIETEENREDTSKKMILKRSFKKSVVGNTRPKPPQKTLKRVVSTSGRKTQGNDDDDEVGHAYSEGIAKGLKRLKFVLVDTTSDISEMEPQAYQAIIANGAGFFLVCSFDDVDSLSYIEKRVEDIRKAKAGSSHTTPMFIIANKSDILHEERVVDELDVNTLAARLHVKYCCASVASEEGCAEMSGLLLNEINVSAEEEEYQKSLPEDYVFFEEEGMADY